MNKIIKIVLILSIFSNTFTNGQDLKDPKKIKSLPKNALIKELGFSDLKNIVMLDSIRYLNTPENFDGKNEFYLKDSNLKEFKIPKKTIESLIGLILRSDPNGFLAIEFGIKKRNVSNKVYYDDFSISIGGRKSDYGKIVNSFSSIKGQYDPNENVNLRDLYKKLTQNRVPGYLDLYGGVIYPIADAKKWIDNIEKTKNNVYLTPSVDYDMNGNLFTNTLFSVEKLDKKEIIKTNLLFPKDPYSSYGDKGQNCCQ